jgi:hypothetical protein
VEQQTAYKTVLKYNPLSDTRVCSLSLLIFPSPFLFIRRSTKPRLTAVGIRCADHATPATRKGWHELRRQAAVARSVKFACGLRPRSLVFFIRNVSGAFSECFFSILLTFLATFIIILGISSNLHIKTTPPP